jgi:hypothetical protein
VLFETGTQKEGGTHNNSACSSGNGQILLNDLKQFHGSSLLSHDFA